MIALSGVRSSCDIVDPGKVVGISAGLEPADHVHPEVVDAMKEVGIDLSDVVPKPLTVKMQTETYFLVTLGCGERCPLIPAGRRVDWELPGPHGQSLERVREIRDAVRARVEELVADRGWSP